MLCHVISSLPWSSKHKLIIVTSSARVFYVVLEAEFKIIYLAGFCGFYAWTYVIGLSCLLTFQYERFSSIAVDRFSILD